MQIAAANPLCIEPKDLDQETINREADIYKQQLIQDGKKPEQIEKIMPGKMKKYYSEVCLLEQEFIKESKKKISELLKEHISKFGENITITKFSRYQVG